MLSTSQLRATENALTFPEPQLPVIHQLFNFNLTISLLFDMLIKHIRP